MKEEKILKKAIEKAVKNGWEYYSPLIKGYCGQLACQPELDIQDEARLIIFSHDFAKAFWGEKENEDLTQCVEFNDIPSNYFCNSTAWQYHLQQMVLKENPIKYLEKFL